MTADGKIACSSGHSSWVSCPDSRKLVFEARARSDAVIVGGNTVRLCASYLLGGHLFLRLLQSYPRWRIDSSSRPCTQHTLHVLTPRHSCMLQSRTQGVIPSAGQER